MSHRVWLAVGLACAVSACGDNADPAAFDAAPDDEIVINPPRTAYDEWQKVELPGTVCGNNTQYKFFVNYSDKSDSLVVVLEPGGACWDYDSCAGKNGIRGAANPNGITDDHYAQAPFISPFLDRNNDDNPAKNWNMIYVPYCTGDVHTGNNVVTYKDETGGNPDLEFHHAGHANMLKVTSWIDEQFTHVPRLLVTGCSAGGAGAITNYYFLRKGIKNAHKGYLLDDSGPIFPSSGYSAMLHTKIRASWNLDSLQPEMPAGFTLDDMGSINTALADQFPDDRLATTFFERDFNYSLYSYERFFNFPPKADIMAMWASDTKLLTDLYATRGNLFYFLPYWRNLNSSHCTTVITMDHSDIEAQNLTLAGWVGDLVSDRPIHSAIEAPVPGEDP
ncbi:MAG: pectinacetylesterase family protein [Deltaproteobacteria bacterium]|nr:pectinacetylesterase family protein [Deltaproteobacteria bacterium]